MATMQVRTNISPEAQKEGGLPQGKQPGYGDGQLFIQAREGPTHILQEQGVVTL